MDVTVTCTNKVLCSNVLVQHLDQHEEAKRIFRVRLDHGTQVETLLFNLVSILDMTYQEQRHLPPVRVQHR